ncbi:hypothetical protein BS50DRAFT_595103 [Corynespora cassiicola Philippines]|uniref:Uncharacterized protein n=1 Tax=Corynespora cassiicola Philippines TaxID=1448308 RepID=A0A2T2N0C7_CORCC|nr:hypothetical protein BS50DRAFT_595103 [Corynespora cassiicola Philippines]
MNEVSALISRTRNLLSELIQFERSTSLLLCNGEERHATRTTRVEHEKLSEILGTIIKDAQDLKEKFDKKEYFHEMTQKLGLPDIQQEEQEKRLDDIADKETDNKADSGDNCDNNDGEDKDDEDRDDEGEDEDDEGEYEDDKGEDEDEDEDEGRRNKSNSLQPRNYSKDRP